MKIKENQYHCGWCNSIITQKVAKHSSDGGLINKGKQNGSAHCVCPYCNRTVSQKKREEMLR